MKKLAGVGAEPEERGYSFAAAAVASAVAASAAAFERPRNYWPAEAVSKVGGTRAIQDLVDCRNLDRDLADTVAEPIEAEQAAAEDLVFQTAADHEAM